MPLPSPGRADDATTAAAGRSPAAAGCPASPAPAPVIRAQGRRAGEQTRPIGHAAVASVRAWG